MYQFTRVVPGEFDITQNFWHLNQQIALLSPYRKLYREDKSKDKQDSSRTMWAIWLYTDPHPQNRIYRQSEENKIEAIRSYVKDFDPQASPWAELIEAYESNALSLPARELKESERSLAKRRRFLDDTPYAEEEPMLHEGQIVTKRNGDPVMKKSTVPTLEAMHKNTAAIFKQYAEAWTLFMQDVEDAKMYGGRNETIRERGALTIDVTEEYEQ